MPSRAELEQPDRVRDRAFWERALSPAQGVKTLLHTLHSLGRLPADFDPAPLVQLATHPHEEVRLAAVKAFARLENPQLLPFYCERIACEDATLVRRELVSAVFC